MWVVNTQHLAELDCIFEKANVVRKIMDLHAWWELFATQQVVSKISQISKMFTDVIFFFFWKTNVFKKQLNIQTSNEKSQFAVLQPPQVFLVVWMHRLTIFSLEDLILSFEGPRRRKKNPNFLANCIFQQNVYSYG